MDNIFDESGCISLDRVNELTGGSLERATAVVFEKNREIEQLREAVRELREALSFYAAPCNWKWMTKSTDTDFILDCGSEVQRDFGAIARSFLAKTEKWGV